MRPPPPPSSSSSPAPAGAKDSRSGPGQERKFFSRRKACRFCTDKVAGINYNDVPTLRNFLTERRLFALGMLDRFRPGRGLLLVFDDGTPPRVWSKALQVEADLLWLDETR